MPRKKPDDTRQKIITCAWELFYQNGYDNTTIEDIVERSNTSKGTFYHYFSAKNELLSTLAALFDAEYEKLEDRLNEEKSAFDKLLFLNRELFRMIENSIPLELLTALYSSQLSLKGDKNLLDHDRIYYKLLRKIVIEGKSNGEFQPDVSTTEIVKAYALFERALISDWCLCNGEYSLHKYSGELLTRFFQGFLNKEC